MGQNILPIHNAVLFSYLLILYTHVAREAVVILQASHISKDVMRFLFVSMHLLERFWGIYARAATEFVQLSFCTTATLLTCRTHCSHGAICACSTPLYKSMGCCSKVCFSMGCCSMVCCSKASISPNRAPFKDDIFTFVVH